MNNITMSGIPCSIADVTESFSPLSGQLYTFTIVQWLYFWLNLPGWVSRRSTFCSNWLCFIWPRAQQVPQNHIFIWKVSLESPLRTLSKSHYVCVSYFGRLKRYSTSWMNQNLFAKTTTESCCETPVLFYLASITSPINKAACCIHFKVYLFHTITALN